MLPIQRPSLGTEELDEVKKVFDTGWLGLGSTVFEFEDKLKEYLGARHVVAVNSGTTALHLALAAFGVGAGDEVILPSLTFCACVQMITALGATPVFCEIEPDTLNIDLSDAHKKVTRQTKAVMPVHYCGNACDLDGLSSLRSDYGLLLIEDAAHAFGSSYKGKKIGSFGDATCFSFDPIKNITCGEGGAVVLSDDRVAEQMRKMRILGIDKDSWTRYKAEQSWYYEVTTQGYRYHMSNINAAIGLAQLRKLDRFVERKRKIVRLYDQHLGSMHGMSLLKGDREETAPFCYMIRVHEGKRNDLIEHLNTRSIGSGVHYIPNHLQPFFKKYSTSLPVTEKVWREIITLPLYYDMSDGDVASVIAAVEEFFDGAR